MFEVVSRSRVEEDEALSIPRQFDSLVALMKVGDLVRGRECLLRAWIH